MDIQVLFNPACSKCRTVRGILEERGVDTDYVRYLEQTPTREQLEGVLRSLGTDDPRDMMRLDEPEYRELHLDSAGRDELLDAIDQTPHTHPAPNHHQRRAGGHRSATRTGPRTTH